jgi:hypothetical protein
MKSSVEVLFFKRLIVFISLFLFSMHGFSQKRYNEDVEAKIVLDKNNEFIKITGTAFNKTELNKSLRYRLSVIKTNPENSNRSKNDQNGRIVLNPNEKKELSTTTINTNEKDKIILLLLIYNLDDKIIGQDRVVLNESPDAIASKQKIIKVLETKAQESQDVDSRSRDGVELSGIVVEDTKTKPGRDFYKLFYALYSRNNINGSKVVTIKEVLAIGSNTKIEVIVGDQIIFSFFVRPRNNYLVEMNDLAITKVYVHFKTLEKESKTIKRY